MALLKVIKCSKVFLPISNLSFFIVVISIQYFGLSPGDLPNSGIELGSPVLQADSLPAELHACIAGRFFTC